LSLIINGVECEEIVKGYSEGADPSVASTKQFLCAWADRYRLGNGLLGFATATSIGPDGRVNFTPPNRHPELNIYSKSIHITGVGRPSQGPKQLAFASAIVEVDYGQLDWAALPEDDPDGAQSIDPDNKFLYCTQEIDYSSEYVTVPGSALKYGPTGSTKPFNTDMPIKIQMVEMSLMFHKLPYLPVGFAPLVDSTNAGKFLGCAAETVKFNGGKVKRDKYLTSDTGSPAGITQAVDFSFTWRPKYPWNMIPDPGGGSSWVPFSYKSGAKVFPATDLSVVFPRGYGY
jgi:hypothetical protein